MATTSPDAPTMSATELREARLSLGASAEKFAKGFGMADGRHVRRWESGARPVAGPVVLLVRLAMKSATVRRELGFSATLVPKEDWNQ